MFKNTIMLEQSILVLIFAYIVELQTSMTHEPKHPKNKKTASD